MNIQRIFRLRNAVLSSYAFKKGKLAPTLQIFAHQGFKSKHEDHSSKNSQQNYIESITKSHIAVALQDLENSLIRRYFRRYSRFQTRLILITVSIFGIVGFALYMFREPIKENLSDEVADVASRSLGDESVVLKANEITKIVLNEIINDEKSQILVSNFVKDIIQTDTVNATVIQLVHSVLNNVSVQEEVRKLVQSTLFTLINDEEVKKMLIDFIRSLLLDETTMKTCRQLVQNLADDDDTKIIFENFFKDVLASEIVTNQAVVLGKNVTQGVVCDESIQKATGDALWNAGIHSVTPRWMR